MKLAQGIQPASNGSNGQALRVALGRQARESAPEMVASLSQAPGKAGAVVLATLYPLLVVGPLVILTTLSPELDRPPIAEVGIDCAFVGFTVLALQFVITARLCWLEAPFGLDLLLRFHRAMALVATALLCVHPALVASAEGWPLLTGLHARWYLWAGRGALALLLVQVTMSLSRRAMGLSYERWRRMHNFCALTLLALGFSHSINIGHGGRGGKVVWATMTAVALGSWIYSRVIRPRLLLRHPFHVTALKAEAPHIWTITLEGPKDRPLRFVPGQFQFLRLHGADVAAEEHPFTIASSPTRTSCISLTVKESGNFSATIGCARPGDRATVHGPFGRFSHTLHPEERELVFVAGGVGITPLMSMLRYMHDRGDSRPVLLVYANRTLDDVVFGDELRAMEAACRPALKVIHVLSQPPAWWAGEAGRLDANRLARLSGSLDHKAFYLCCPPAMAAGLIQGLRRMRVSPRRIHCDYFSL